MIIVLEGISAAGKTTYASQFGAQYVVPEFPEQQPVPDHSEPTSVHARYWIEHNFRRFEAALQIEARYGFAICDTDPFKSHFDWCRARAGFSTMDLFEHAMPIAEGAIAERRLGFADRYYIKRIAPEVAKAQKEGDLTRSRDRFDMHLALQPHLMAWFEALDAVLPGRVEFAFATPNDLRVKFKEKAPDEDPRRFDVSVLTELLERLPH